MATGCRVGLQNLGNDGVAGKTLRWSVLSESPSSYAAKASSAASSFAPAKLKKLLPQAAAVESSGLLVTAQDS